MPTYPVQQDPFNATEWDQSTLNSSCEGSIITTQWDGHTYGLRAIGNGSAGIIFVLDNDRVVKVYVGSDAQSTEDLETERQAYINLGSGSQHVLKCLEIDSPYGLVFERCQTTVRRKIRSRQSEYLPQNDALRYAIQAADGLAFVHSCDIVQGDVGCHNMLINKDGILKIADFAGSSVKGSSFKSSVAYEIGSRMPGKTEPSIRTDIFAFGSAIYELINKRPPYHGRSYAEIQRMFRQKIFPEDFEPCPKLKYIVEKCWGKGGRPYTSMKEVRADLCELSPHPISSETLRSASRRNIPKVLHHTGSPNFSTDASVDTVNRIANGHEDTIAISREA